MLITCLEAAPNFYPARFMLGMLQLMVLSLFDLCYAKCFSVVCQDNCNKKRGNLVVWLELVLFS
jgi:hypothetical protein